MLVRFVCCEIIRVFIRRIHSFDSNMIWKFAKKKIPTGVYIMQEPSYPGHIALASIWSRMVLTQIITWVLIDTLVLRYPPISI